MILFGYLVLCCGDCIVFRVVSCFDFYAIGVRLVLLFLAIYVDFRVVEFFVIG